MSEPDEVGATAAARVAVQVARVRASHERLLAEVAVLPPDVARRDSQLPGWTVGHVLTHLARNADSHAGILEGASRSEVVPQYPGGPAQRLADIDAGAGRELGALLADLRASITQLEASYGATPPAAWETGTALLGAGERPLAELPFRRWREVEVHRVDLGTGATPESWPRGYVIEELAHQVVRVADRLPPERSLVLRTTDTGQAWEITPARVKPRPGPIGLPRRPGPEGGGARATPRPPGGKPPVSSQGAGAASTAPPARAGTDPEEPAPSSDPPAMTVEAPAAELVAWLLGRLALPGAPTLASWEAR
jgi:maleylpyruvate isomerase